MGGGGTQISLFLRAGAQILLSTGIQLRTTCIWSVNKYTHMGVVFFLCYGFNFSVFTNCHFCVIKCTLFLTKLGSLHSHFATFLIRNNNHGIMATVMIITSCTLNTLISLNCFTCIEYMTGMVINNGPIVNICL